MAYATVSPRAAAFGLAGPEASVVQRLQNLEGGGIVTPAVGPAEYTALMAWWRHCDPEGHDAWKGTHPAQQMPRVIYDHMATYVGPKLDAMASRVYKDIFGRPKPEAEQVRLRTNAAWHEVKDSLGCPSGTYREQVFGFAPRPLDVSRTLISSVTAIQAPPPVDRKPPPPTDRKPPPTTAECGRGYVLDPVTAQCVPAVGYRAPTNGAPPPPPVCPAGTLFDPVAKACLPTGVVGPSAVEALGPSDAEDEILEELEVETAAMAPFRLPWWVWLGMALGGVGVAFWIGKRGEPKGNPRVPGGEFRFDKVADGDYDVFWRYGSPATIGFIAPKEWTNIGRVWKFSKSRWQTNEGLAKTRLEGAYDLLERAEQDGKVTVPIGTWLHAGR